MDDLIKRADAIKGKMAGTANVNAEFLMGMDERERRIFSIGYADGWNEHINKCKYDIPSAEPTIEIDADQLEKLLREGWTIHSEPKQGEWIPYEAPLNFGDGEYYVTEHKCSACGYLWGEPDYKYCPECGARMKGADDEEV